MTGSAAGSYRGRSVLVAGAGLSGVAAAEVLLRLGAWVTVTDRLASARTEALTALGATVALELSAVPAGIEQVVTSPGWRPDHPVLSDAAARGVEVIGEIELAWRLRGPAAAPWLAVTGTNGKTTTVEMLAAILRAAGLRTVAAGNIGRPLVQVVGEPYDVLAVELSSFQLHWSSTVVPQAAAVLNIAADHLDWHGTLERYAADKGKIFAPGTVAVYNADEPSAARLAGGPGAGLTLGPPAAGFTLGPPAAGFTLGPPAAGQLGVVEGVLVDRAFGRGEFAAAADIALPGPHNIANALAAAGLAFSSGVPASAAGTGLRAFRPGPHRNCLVGAFDGVRYVDDSKATNPHAAAASLAAYDRVVWVAGGLLKGADVDDLVGAVASRLAGVVLLGADRSAIADALARHAPDVPVVDVDRTDDGAMQYAVDRAAGMARPGDVVLLAPAAASMDMFSDYGARGDAFVAAARRRGVA